MLFFRDGIFLEKNEKGFCMYTAKSEFRKFKKTFFGAVTFFIRKNPTPRNFWEITADLEDAVNNI